MLLREFLYVDTIKVRGLLAQIDEGIVEATTSAESRLKRSGAGLKGFAEHAQEWAIEQIAQKSLGDVLFPVLESALETEGYLRDLSLELAQDEFWANGVKEAASPGQLVRITGSARLLDARFVADTLSGFAAVAQGLAGLSPQKNASGQGRPASRPGKNQARNTPSGSPQLEDAIPEASLAFAQESIEPSLLRAIIQVSRGLFRPGLHFVMNPTQCHANAITARLQEGRDFLDGEPDILFARYGMSPQDWTIVGIVGHHGADVKFDSGQASFIDEESSNIIRPAFAAFVNDFLSYQASIGFADAPQRPGFSVIPLAVYRVLPGSAVLGGDAALNAV